MEKEIEKRMKWMEKEQSAKVRELEKRLLENETKLRQWEERKAKERESSDVKEKPKLDMVEHERIEEKK